jgi:L,D-peptidoglycan transpeptidase YkuD (ErfK/YbiS/YcfS/YnhG family)
MIIINKYGYLKYKDSKFKCALGKSGVGKKKIEGDNITPQGTYKVIKIYYRKDRIKKISSKFKLIKINKDMGWCDDPKSNKYNQLINLPSNFKYEKFYRKDRVYDLILVLNYNMNPIVKGKGSGIFIHVCKRNYKKTAGCIALKKTHLIQLVKEIKKETKIIIN